MERRGLVDQFVAGAIGEPGDRTFLLQFVVGGATETYLVEKAQVEALAEQSLELLEQAGFAGSGADVEPGSLLAPTELVFRVDAMQLSYSEETGLIELLLGAADEELDPVAYELTPAQLDAASRAALEVVAAGRPRCPRCGLAMDPDGHACPATNGDLRHHRP